MPEAWIRLQCPNCEQSWEASPSDLPEPRTTFECRHCGERRPMAEFMHSSRDLEILKEFHPG